MDEERFDNINKKLQIIKNLVANPNWYKKLSLMENNTGKNGIIYDSDEYVLKIIPMMKDELENNYSLKYPSWRELMSLRWINRLVKENICPNFGLLYNYYALNDCSYFFRQKKTYGCLLLFLEKADGTLYDLLKHFSSTKTAMPANLWKSILFQILAAIYSIQHHYGLIHRDLHWRNVLYWKVKPTGYWLYYIKKIPYYLPCLGFRVGLCDFGKAMRREDAFLSHNSNQYTKDSKHIFIQGNDEKWRDWYLYQSEQIIQDILRISNLPRWIKDENFPKNIMPISIENLLNKIRTKWTVKKHYLPSEIIMLTMKEYLDPRIGQNYNGKINFNDKHYRPGKFVIYKGKLAMIAIKYSNFCKIIISDGETKEIKSSKLVFPNNLPENPITSVIGTYYLD